VSSGDDTARVEIRFFGPLTDLVPTPVTTTELSLPCTVAQIRQYLEGRAPKLAGRPYRIAVDEVIRKEEDTISSIREIALLPPFAGG